MSTFESKATVNQPIAHVYDFLTDMNNHRQLMSDSVTDWISTYDTISFNIQNMAKLSLAVESRVQNSEINIFPSEKPPFNLNLKWSLTDKNEQTEVLFTIFADLNMMLKMLASGPLQKLADHETSALVSIMSKT